MADRINPIPPLSGMISDIQRASVHDGPGIRTTVFFKGCQMRCPWCHNPETISFRPEELFYPDKCIGCGLCAEGCFSGARVTVGRRMTVAEVMSEVEFDRPYYGMEGGITLSGGEPLCQPDFALALLSDARSRGISTALETNMGVPWDVALPVLGRADLLMADLKLWDPGAHLRWVGAGNEVTIENLLRADGLKIPIILRTPVIPGVNDNADNIVGTAVFAAKLRNLRYYELLAYHPLGVGKAAALRREAPRFEKSNKDDLLRLAAAATEAAGIRVAVNGVLVEEA